MENVVLSFKCRRSPCAKYNYEITQCALSLGGWIITQGGPVFDHLLQLHPGERTLSLVKGAKFRPFTNYDISPSLLIKHETFYEKQPLNVAYVYRDEKLKRILTKVMNESIAGVTLQTGDLQMGSVSQKILALSHFIYLRNEIANEISLAEDLFAKDLSFGQQLMAISTPFSAITLHNSWSQGTICNIIDHYIALADLKITLGSEGAPVFSLNNGKVGPLVGLIISNITYRNGHLTGFNVLALPSSFMNNLPIFTSYVPCIYYTPSSIQELEGQQSVVQVCTNKGWGSGTVIKDGLIITCAHIVNYGEASDIFIATRKKFYPAKVLFSTPNGHTSELAILEITDAYIDVTGLIPIRCRNRKISLGEDVYTVGYCLFERLMGPTVTRGIISTLNQHCIITTCSVHYGASGGPLLDRNGELLGVITSNVRIYDFVYPTVNVNTAIYSFGTSIENFILTRDTQILKNWSTSVPPDAAVIQIRRIPNKF